MNVKDVIRMLKRINIMKYMVVIEETKVGY